MLGTRYGLSVWIQGGSSVVDPQLDQLLAANVSLAGLWVEDWCGTYRDDLTGSVQVNGEC